MEALDDLAVALRERLIERARSGESGGAGLDAEVRSLVEREAGSLPGDEREALCRRVLLLATGLGPLEPLLSDPSVDEVMVNGPGEVYVERRGRIERTAVSFGGEAELMHAIERILAPLGRRVDEASPLCDARLPGRLARERGDPAAVAVRAVPDGAALPARGLLAARAGGARDAAG